MRKTPLMMCCSAALLLGVAGCTADRTDDTLADRPLATDPTATQPMETAPPTDTATLGQTMPRGAAMLSVATGAAGEYLADNQGRALYMLENDRDGSKCTGACLQAWPPLRAADQTGAAGTTGVAGPGATGVAGAQVNLRTDLVGTIQRADGTTQATYNGHPLYRYAKDTGPGTTTGHDVEDQWGEWYLVTPAGDAIGHDD